MSSNTTGERRWPAELTDTILAPSAAASASRSPTASEKWPRWFEANCNSCPLGAMVSSGVAITPALFTRMSSGPVQARTKAATLDRSLRSMTPTSTLWFLVLSRIPAATRSPYVVLRTASVTDAPAAASARAVSTPIPDEAPVTIAVLPVRSTPAMTSAAVDSGPNGVVTRSSDVAGSPAPSVMVTAYSGDGLLGFARDAFDKYCGGVLFGNDVDGLARPDGNVVRVAAADCLAERGPGRIVDVGLAALPGIGHPVAQRSGGVALRPR